MNLFNFDTIFFFRGWVFSPLIVSDFSLPEHFVCGNAGVTMFQFNNIFSEQSLDIVQNFDELVDYCSEKQESRFPSIESYRLLATSRLLV